MTALTRRRMLLFLFILFLMMVLTVLLWIMTSEPQEGGFVYQFY